MKEPNFHDFNQSHRYSVAVETRLILPLLVTEFRPEAMRVTERKAASGIWFEVETFNEIRNQWIEQKTHSTEAQAIDDANGWYPEKLISQLSSPADVNSGSDSDLFPSDYPEFYSSLKATWNAVKSISGDRINESYEKAGLTFQRDGRFVVVMKDDAKIAHMTPQFNRHELHDALIGNIQSSAKEIARVLTKAFKELHIPNGYGFSFAPEQSIRDVASFHGNNMSVFIRIEGNDTDAIPEQVDTEIRVFLDEPRAILFANKGARFFGESRKLLESKDRFVYAKSYNDLASRLVELVNHKVMVHVEQTEVSEDLPKGAITAAQLDKEKAPIVKEGMYVGRIVKIEDGFAVQKIGRDPSEVVQHDVAYLSRVPALGQVADIRYLDGNGIVKKDRGVEIDKGRT